jgi:hypothetical protein
VADPDDIDTFRTVDVLLERLQGRNLVPRVGTDYTFVQTPLFEATAGPHVITLVGPMPADTTLPVDSATYYQADARRPVGQ